MKILKVWKIVNKFELVFKNEGGKGLRSFIPPAQIYTVIFAFEYKPSSSPLSLLWEEFPPGDEEKWKGGVLPDRSYHDLPFCLFLSGRSILCVGACSVVLRHLMASQLCLCLKLCSTGATLITLPGEQEGFWLP